MSLAPIIAGVGIAFIAYGVLRRLASEDHD